MHTRDLGIIILSFCGLFVSLYHDNETTLRPSWRMDTPTPLLDTHHITAQQRVRVPKPVVGDLDGDGNNEIIVVTREPKIKILDAGSGTPSGSGDFFSLKEKATSSLLSRVHISTGRHPVALAIGYLDKYVPGKSRRQVIVVVTEEWKVLCFDHRLKLLWESSVKEHHSGVSGFVHREIAVLISPLAIKESDRGSIIVGGRLTADPKLMEKNSQPRGRQAGEGANEADSHPESSGAGRAGHFSYYAFDGKRGSLRWKHDAEDFHEELGGDVVLTPQNNYKIDVRSHQKHLGETNWRSFRDSIILHLPHRWTDRDETHFRLAHFNKKAKREHQLQRNQAGPDYRPPAAVDENVSRGLPLHKLEANNLHSASNAVHNPNVVIAHTADGIEVLHAYTGRPLCRLALEEKHAHADLNGDGVIDHVAAADHFSLKEGSRDWGNAMKTPGCLAVATTGVPAADQLYNATVCRAFSPLDWLKAATEDDLDEATRSVRSLPPVLVRRTRYDSAHSTHTYDAAFATSVGRVTSVGPNGRTNWQVDTAASWESLVDTAVGESFSEHVTSMPSLNIMRFRTHSVQEAIVVVGQKHFTVLSEDGYVLSSLDLPAPLIGPITIGDFNNDSWNDLVFTTARGYVAYSFETKPGTKFFTTAIGALIALVTALMVQQTVSKSRSNAKGRKHAKGRYQM